VQENTQTYEIAVWLQPSIDGAGESSVPDILRSEITASGGIIVNESKPSIKKLAYPIKKQLEAIFFIITAELSPIAAGNIRKRLDNSAGVLRLGIFKSERRKTRMKRSTLLHSKPRKNEATESVKEKLPESRPEVKMEELDKKLEELLQSRPLT